MTIEEIVAKQNKVAQYTKKLEQAKEDYQYALASSDFTSAEFLMSSMLFFEKQLMLLTSMAKLGEEAGISYTMRNEEDTRHHVWHVHCDYQGFSLILDFHGEYLAGDMPHKKFAKAVIWVNKHEQEILTKARELGYTGL